MNTARSHARPTLTYAAVCVLGVALTAAAARTVFVTAATEIAPSPSAPSAARVAPDAGADAPPAEAASYEPGRTVGLAEYRGHPVVLNFWASWCPPCRAEVGVLERAYLAHRGRGLVVIGIDAQTDAWQTSDLFLRQHGVTYPAGRDVNGAIARAYRVGDLPMTYFINAEGRVVGTPVMGGFTGTDGEQDLARDIGKLLQ